MRAEIEIRDLHKRYGAVRAVDGLSLSAPAGARIGLVGPNGAGKTTTLGLLCGLLRPDRGEIRIGGEPVRPATPLRGRIAALPQDSALPASRRVGAELSWLARLQGLRGSRRTAAVACALESTQLTELSDRRIGQLSHGQRRRVQIAQALLGDEPVIVLDEPTAGVDPRTALQIRRDLSAFTEGRTLVWSSHDLNEVEDLCTHVFVLDRGRVVAGGAMDELLRATRLLRFELGPEAFGDTLRADVTAVEGVQEVSIVQASCHLTVQCDPSAALDAVTQRLLGLFVEKRWPVRSLARGEPLAERFWAATTRRE